MCVCLAACHQTHKPSPQNLAWAPHFTWARYQARGQPKMLAPGPAHGPAHFCSLVPQINLHKPTLVNYINCLNEAFWNHFFVLLNNFLRLDFIYLLPIKTQLTHIIGLSELTNKKYLNKFIFFTLTGHYKHKPLT